jgi:hypothetical protein
LVACIALLCSAAASATENGVSQQPIGGDGFLTPYLPPQGTTQLYSYTFYHRADRYNNGSGTAINAPDFNLQVFGESLRVLHVYHTQLLGGDLASQMVLPVANARLTNAGDFAMKTGIGDMTVTPVMVGWHYSSEAHALAGLDFNLPTGQYDPTSTVNIGQNHFSFDLFYAVAYTKPNGPNAFLATFLNFNTKNNATGYRNGDEFLLNYAFGWNVGQSGAGVQGSFWNQLTDDHVNGQKVSDDGNRSHLFSIGPSIFTILNGPVYLFAWWERDFVARNTSQGDRVTLKAIFFFF